MILRFAAMASLAAGFAAQAAAPEWRVLNAAQVYLRDGPSTEARALARLPAGLEVEWLGISAGGPTGDAAFCNIRYAAPSGATKTGHVARAAAGRWPCDLGSAGRRDGRLLCGQLD